MLVPFWISPLPYRQTAFAAKVCKLPFSSIAGNPLAPLTNAEPPARVTVDTASIPVWTTYCTKHPQLRTSRLGVMIVCSALHIQLLYIRLYPHGVMPVIPRKSIVELAENLTI